MEAQIAQFLFESVENIVEMGENTGYQHFLFFHNVSKRLFLERVKIYIMSVNPLTTN